MTTKSLADRLKKLKVPKVLMAGLLMASVLGWTGYKNLDKVKNYYLRKKSKGKKIGGLEKINKNYLGGL